MLEGVPAASTQGDMAQYCSEVWSVWSSVHSEQGLGVQQEEKQAFRRALVPIPCHHGQHQYHPDMLMHSLPPSFHSSLAVRPHTLQTTLL